MVICIDIKNLDVESLSGFKILENVSLSIECSDFVVVSGPSGGGKSTLLKVVLGLRDVLENLRVSGEVRVFGINILNDGFDKLFGRVGVVLQNPVNQIFSLTVEEEIAFPLENMGLDPDDIRKRVDEAIRIMELENLRKTPVHSLSMGQIQRVVLASIMAMHPDIILLDEPCAYLDPTTKRRFYEYIYRYWRSRGATIVVVEHDLDYVLNYANKILILNRRVIAYGHPLEVLGRIDVEEYGIKEPTYIKICKHFNRVARDMNDVINCLKNFICQSR